MKRKGPDLVDIAAFVDVVESGSITASARRLDTSKSVISTRITALESDLAASLFHRSSSRLTLTQKGESLYARAKGILDDVRRLNDDAADAEAELRGTLRIAAPTSFTVMYLSDLFSRFMMANPGVNLIIDLDDKQTDIAGGGYDLGIRIGQMTDTSLIGRKICSVRRIMCCSPSYAKTYGVPQKTSDLVGHACLTYGNIVSTAHWSFQSPSGDPEPLSAHIQYRLVANNGEVQRDAAIAGLGLILIPSFIVVDALLTGKLQVVSMDLEPAGLECFALYPRQRHAPRALRKLIDFLAREIGSPPIWDTQLKAVHGYWAHNGQS